MSTYKCVATALICNRLRYCAVDVVSVMLQFNDYIQVANGAPRPVKPKNGQADPVLVTKHKEWCRSMLNRGGQLLPCHHTV